MRKKKVHHEEHMDETWLIPYADMLTLLLALFIVMFAMSKVDNEKFRSVQENFNAIFSGGSGLLLEEGGPTLPVPESGNSGDSEETPLPNNVVEDNKMKEIMENLDQQIKSEGYSDKVKVDLNEGGLEISIQDVVLFNSGDAQVLKGVEPFLIKISNMVKGLDNDIKIVGHTDNLPIHNDKFRSNWDLSAMRAINVMNYMSSVGGVREGRLSIQAFGEQKPKYDNSTADGRAKNRRVEIFVVRKYTAPEKTNRN